MVRNTESSRARKVDMRPVHDYHAEHNLLAGSFHGASVSPSRNRARNHIR